MFTSLSITYGFQDGMVAAVSAVHDRDFQSWASYSVTGDVIAETFGSTEFLELTSTVDVGTATATLTLAEPLDSAEVMLITEVDFRDPAVSAISAQFSGVETCITADAAPAIAATGNDTSAMVGAGLAGVLALVLGAFALVRAGRRRSA